MPRRDARRARDAGRRAPGIAAAALIFAVCGAFLPGALAAPFASHTELRTAVRNCLAAVPSGLNCCSSGGADCGAAGSVDMPDWDTSLVTDMSGTFFNCDGLSGSVDVVRDVRRLVVQQQDVQPGHLQVEHLKRDDDGENV
jgi:surface protein